MTDGADQARHPAVASSLTRSPDNVIGFSRRRLGGACAAYALLMLYASTVIGPAGVNFVDQDSVAVFQKFLATRYVINGSDQRADWMGNLLMLVPFGFLMTGLLWPKRPILKLPAAVLAMLISAGTIIAIKYLQLYFPPRTVTLNYIAAQAAGAAIGCAGFAGFHHCIGRSVSRHDPVGGLVLALRIYCGLLVIFLLMPLDFALDATDLRTQFGRLPAAMTALPGANRPMLVRAIMLVVAAVAFIPVGMLLTFIKTGVHRVRRGLWAVAGWGLAITTVMFALTALVISAYPAMAAIIYRTCGILTGAGVLLWITRQDPPVLRQQLRRSAPWLAALYSFAVLLVNHLLALHWLTPREAIAQAYPLGLLPLFDYYIVSKADAAKNIVGHALLYGPIGVLLWMRYDTAGGGRACFVAAVVAFLVELARYCRPGLEGDVNAVALAGVSAMLAARMMPAAWLMLEALVRQSATAPDRAWPSAGLEGVTDA